MKKAILLDVSAIMYRSFYANKYFKTKNEPTGAVYGFLNTLLSIIKEFKPSYIAAAFDVKRSSLERTKLFKDYKNKRDAVPEDLVSQIPRIEELLDAFKIDRFKIEGFEADDVLATLSNKISQEKNMEVIVVTGDKDLAQLVSNKISIALLGKGSADSKFEILKTEEDVINFIGVAPNRICELFALIGDASDGIPGVRKIGPEKALALLNVYENIEEIYEHIEELKDIKGFGKTILKNLEEDREIAFLSRELATVKRDLPLDISLKNMDYNIDGADIERDKLINLLKTLEFNSILKKYKLIDNTPYNFSLFESATQSNESKETKNLKKIDEKINIEINNKEELEELSSNLKDEKYISIFILDETNLNYTSISTSKNTFFIDAELMPAFAEIIKEENFKNLKILAYNFKAFLKKGYIFNFENCFDMMLAYHLITSETKKDVTLPIKKYLACDLPSFKDFLARRKIEAISKDEIKKYMIRLAELLFACYEDLEDELKKLNLTKVFKDIEMPLIEVLNQMEENGIKIDKDYFKSYKEELSIKLLELEKNIYIEAGEEFNINSPKQLSEILFDKMGIKSTKKTKTGYSTDVSVLENLSEKGIEIAKYLLEHRKLNKLKTTYVEAIPLLADENLLIHTSFNQIGTATGRLSSSDPNLQNIPVKTEEGIKIREGFVARSGKSFLSVDYSQVELRVLAFLSKDENLIKAYQNKLDLHTETARRIFNLSEDEEVSREERAMAKTINFSIIYGKTPFGLSRELGISVAEASLYIDRYFKEYSRVKNFESEILDFARKNGFVKTLFGRIRFINDINSNNKNLRAAADRIAVNTVIQGTAAEIIKKVMIKIHEHIKDKKDIKLILQVHDELIFEIDDNKIEDYKKDIAHIMKNSVKLEDVDLDINISIGKNWASAK